MTNSLKISLVLVIGLTIFGCKNDKKKILEQPQEEESVAVEEGVVINGIRWATRNLDVGGVFTKKPEDYGALFQWGRPADGHESRTSKTTSTLSKSDIPGHANFILCGIFNSPYDWRSPQNDALWSYPKTINDPCPCGWRLPTEAELKSLVAAGGVWITQNGVEGRCFRSDDNILFLPAVGYRGYSNGAHLDVGAYGYYWSSSVNGTHAHYSHFGDKTFYVTSDTRAHGFSVRCVAE